jgi:hypothetical protein
MSLNYRNVKIFVKWLWILLIMGIIIGLTSCSAQWHYQRAIEKNPDVWKPTEELLKMKPFKVESSDFNIMLTTGKINLHESNKTASGEVKEVKLIYKFKDIELSRQDSLNIVEALSKIEAIIECPDAEFIEIPTPIKPGIKEQIKFGLIGAGAFLLLFASSLIFKRRERSANLLKNNFKNKRRII